LASPHFWTGSFAGVATLQAFSSIDSQLDEIIVEATTGMLRKQDEHAVVSFSVADLDVVDAGMPNDVSWHAEPLAAAIDEAPERVQRLLLRNPAALALTTSQLADGSLSLASATGLQPIQTLAMLVKRPFLLQLQPQVGAPSPVLVG
jgi:hypothetical protein